MNIRLSTLSRMLRLPFSSKRRELMNEVAKLGFHCRELRKFCAWETRARMQNVGSPYCCAFAEGLSGECWRGDCPRLTPALSILLLSV